MTPCNAASARPALWSRPRRFTIAGARRRARRRRRARKSARRCRAICAAAAPMTASSTPWPRPAPASSTAAMFVSPRVEARAKVTGAAKYTVDIRHDGQQEGVILRSQLAHARISELDLAPARAMPGVSAVVSLLGDDRMVRFVGDAIAAVAAKDRKTALAAHRRDPTHQRSDCRR